MAACIGYFTEFFADLSSARVALDTQGGWLLDVGGSYFVTEDEGVVTDLRGGDYVARCKLLQCWDETQMPDVEG